MRPSNPSVGEFLNEDQKDTVIACVVLWYCV